MRSGATFAAARDHHVGGLEARDRHLAHELAAGVLRRRTEIDAALDLASADPRLHDILRLGAYQLRALARVPAYAAVSTSVELAREIVSERAARYVNQALRKLQRGSGLATRDSDDTHPTWLLERWRRQFGADATERLVAWNDTKPSLVIQPARWGGGVLSARLRAAGLGVEEAPFGAGLRVIPSPEARGPSPVQLPGFAEGGFIVQDPAASLVCRYAGIPQGTLAYDACAAPGGKAVALERLGARVIAGDARPDRIGRLRETAQRAGVEIRVVVADLLSAPFGDCSLPAVLVDAPCTATGTMARHPDARWRVSQRAVIRAAERQRCLLDRAARLVTRGGILVYATCSLEPEENSDLVNDFLERHSEFVREPPPVRRAVPAQLLTADGDFESLPHRHGMDGAYAARLVRRA